MWDPSGHDSYVAKRQAIDQALDAIFAGIVQPREKYSVLELGAGIQPRLDPGPHVVVHDPNGRCRAVLRDKGYRVASPPPVDGPEAGAAADGAEPIGVLGERHGAVLVNSTFCVALHSGGADAVLHLAKQARASVRDDGAIHVTNDLALYDRTATERTEWHPARGTLRVALPAAYPVSDLANICRWAPEEMRTAYYDPRPGGTPVPPRLFGRDVIEISDMAEVRESVLEGLRSSSLATREVLVPSRRRTTPRRIAVELALALDRDDLTGLERALHDLVATECFWKDIYPVLAGCEGFRLRGDVEAYEASMRTAAHAIGCSLTVEVVTHRQLAAEDVRDVPRYAEMMDMPGRPQGAGICGGLMIGAGSYALLIYGRPGDRRLFQLASVLHLTLEPWTAEEAAEAASLERRAGVQKAAAKEKYEAAVAAERAEPRGGPPAALQAACKEALAKYGEAITAYEAAMAIHPSPAYLSNICLCRLRQARLAPADEAVAFYRLGLQVADAALRQRGSLLSGPLKEVLLRRLQCIEAIPGTDPGVVAEAAGAYLDAVLPSHENTQPEHMTLDEFMLDAQCMKMPDGRTRGAMLVEYLGPLASREPPLDHAEFEMFQRMALRFLGSLGVKKSLTTAEKASGMEVAALYKCVVDRHARPSAGLGRSKLHQAVERQRAAIAKQCPAAARWQIESTESRVQRIQQQAHRLAALGPDLAESWRAGRSSSITWMTTPERPSNPMRMSTASRATKMRTDGEGI